MTRLLLWGLFLAGGACRADVILSIAPPTQTVQLGTEAIFDLDISGFGGGTSLGTYDVNISFDPTLLSYNNTVFGNQVDISGLGDIQTVTPGPDTVDLFELSLDSPADLNTLQASAFTLATLSFDTLVTATNSPLTLSINALGDAYGNSISADIVDGSVSVSGASATTAPEPNPKVLLLLLFPAFAALRMISTKSKFERAS